MRMPTFDHMGFQSEGAASTNMVQVMDLLSFNPLKTWSE